MNRLDGHLAYLAVISSTSVVDGRICCFFHLWWRVADCKDARHRAPGCGRGLGDHGPSTDDETHNIWRTDKIAAIKWRLMTVGFCFVTFSCATANSRWETRRNGWLATFRLASLSVWIRQTAPCVLCPQSVNMFNTRSTKKWAERITLGCQAINVRIRHQCDVTS